MDFQKIIPKSSKGFLIWGIVILVAIIIYWQIKKIIDNLKNPGTTEQAEEEVKKSELSYPLSQYNYIADSIHSALGGTDLITWSINDKDIYSKLSLLKNKSDFNQLVSSFGERKLSLLSSNANLIQWFQSKLSSSQLAKVKQILTQINITI